MKKDITRDYAVSAFRLWARLGYPSAEALKISGEGDFALLADVAACEKCFRLLENEEGGLICDAVREVYMRNPSRGLYKREITGRVIRFSAERYISERQVYNYLSRARRLFSSLRGLRSD